MSILPLALRAAAAGPDSMEEKQLKALVSSGERPTIIAVDFDGTLCENRWPDFGPENRTLLEVLLLLQRLGVLLVLWTCRECEDLEAALDWCSQRGLRFEAVNDNCRCITELFGWNSRKVHADEYWDDRAVAICCGTPLHSEQEESL